MNKKRIIKSSTIILFLVSGALYSSCSTYSELKGEYDENFNKTISEALLPNLNDEDFNQASMLQWQYNLTLENDFEIYAPSGGTSYTWEITDSSIDLSQTKGRDLHFYVSSSYFESGRKYTLTLTAVNESGKVLTDSTKLFVFSPDK